MYLKDHKVADLPITRILPMQGEDPPTVFLAEHVGWSGRDTKVWVVADGEQSVTDGLRGFLRFLDNDGGKDVEVISAGPGNAEEMAAVADALEEIHASTNTSSGMAIQVVESVIGNAFPDDARLSDAEIWIGYYGNPADSIDAAVALATEVGIDPKRLLAEAASHNELRHVTRHIARRFTVRLLRGLAAGR